MSKPFLKFECVGGPANGCGFGPWRQHGPNSLNPDQVLAQNSFGVMAKVTRDGQVYEVAGRYKITFDEEAGTYTATHVPSGQDVYAPGDEPSDV